MPLLYACVAQEVGACLEAPLGGSECQTLDMVRCRRKFIAILLCCIHRYHVAQATWRQSGCKTTKGFLDQQAPSCKLWIGFWEHPLVNGTSECTLCRTWNLHDGQAAQSNYFPSLCKYAIPQKLLMSTQNMQISMANRAKLLRLTDLRYGPFPVTSPPTWCVHTCDDVIDHTHEFACSSHSTALLEVTYSLLTLNFER